MNGLSRNALALATALMLSAPLAACGEDSSDEVTTPAGQTGAAGTTGTTGSGGNGPDSAGDRDPDAPDNSISERPGGPQGGGADQNGPGGPDRGNQGGAGSGGLTPPSPQPTP
jgi:hypothetical protein